MCYKTLCVVYSSENNRYRYLQEGDDLGILLGGADDLSDPGDGSTALVTSGSGKEGPDVLGAGAQPFADVLGVQELRVHRGSYNKFWFLYTHTHTNMQNYIRFYISVFV